MREVFGNARNVMVTVREDDGELIPVIEFILYTQEKELTRVGNSYTDTERLETLRFAIQPNAARSVAENLLAAANAAESLAEKLVRALDVCDISLVSSEVPK